MKKFGFAVIAASGLSGAVLGLASPAQAQTPAAVSVPATAPSATAISTGIDHVGWLDEIRPKVNVPQVTAVRH